MSGFLRAGFFAGVIDRVWPLQASTWCALVREGVQFSFSLVSFDRVWPFEASTLVWVGFGFEFFAWIFLSA